jgi:RNA polymerase sigma-70 factor, ECF subfamily
MVTQLNSSAGLLYNSGYRTDDKLLNAPSGLLITCMATALELDQFLARTERKAFKQAVYAVREEQAALDLVQDAMIRLSTKYGDRPVEELGPLFTRILQNATLDHFRREKVRKMWISPLSIFTSDDGEGGNDTDPLEVIGAQEGSEQAESASDKVERSQTLKIIDEALQNLPERQRQAFVLRYWEELDVAETAKMMGCSEGSVKTHCSRANHALAKLMGAQGITL